MTTSTNQVDADLLQEVLNLTESGAEFNDLSFDAIRDPATGRIVSSLDGSDASLNVQFTLESVFDKLESVKARRAGDMSPKYRDMEFITVSAPGQERNTLIHTPVTDYYQWRFSKEYSVFKAGLAAQVVGTPLSLWPIVSPSQAKELEYHGVRTVEQVASLNDSFAGFQGLKAKAKQFLEGNKDTAQFASLQVELDEREASHKAELAAMKAQLEQMAAEVKKRRAGS